MKSPPAEAIGAALSAVVPVFNERANIDALLARLLPILEGLFTEFEIIFVDDGSSDGSADVIAERAAADPRVRILRLSRNFGHQAALLAGLSHARGDAVVTLDGDLQHPPELIPELVARWRAGAEVVQAIRRQPADASGAKRICSRGFYRLLSAVSHLRLTPGAADFRLMSREAVDAFVACQERCRFNRGLVQWIGFEATEVKYDAEERHAGESKYSWPAMLRLAGDAIFSFSSWPLRLAGLAGAAVSGIAAAYLVFVLWARLFTEYTVPGWTSTLAGVLVLGGMNLIVLWILGEYVGRLYEEVKQRPIFIVRQPRRDAAARAAQAAQSADRLTPVEKP